jgi:threonine synthase
MHPHGRISRTQELQMTSVLDANVFNLAIEGTFDDCQHILKTLFNDLELKDRLQLGSVNSINWARVLAQIVYYFYGAFRVMQSTGAGRVAFAVPTGNFGDIFAGYLAARMGLPIARLVLATNENDILARFFNTGVYRRGSVHATLSPSMDIQVASNFERYLYYRVGEDPARLRTLMRAFAETGDIRLDPAAAGGGGDELFAAGAGDTEATLSTIRRVHAEHGYLLDPHSAVGVAVGLRHRLPATPLICLATAHPAKFGEAIRQALGRDAAHHPALDALDGWPTRMAVLPATPAAVRAYLEEHAVPAAPARG